jgi:hypothetical protein
MPHSPEEALQKSLAQEIPASVGCILTTQPIRRQPMLRHQIFETLRSTTRASATGSVPLAATNPASWLLEFVRELSHSAPLDVALFEANRGFLNQNFSNATFDKLDELMRENTPYLIASRDFVQHSRLSERVAEIGYRLTGSDLRDRPVAIESESATARMAGQGFFTLGQVGDWMSTVSRDVAYLRESDMATVAAEMSQQLSSATDPTQTRSDGLETAAESREDRFIQARVSDIDGETTNLLPAFKRDTVHRVTIRIGVPDGSWLGIEEHSRFPEDELPDKENNELAVILTAPDILKEPLTTSIVLRRTGNSTAADFYLYVPETATQVNARIVVMHRNRVLQTALLTGPVGEGKEVIRLVPEAFIRQNLGSLRERSRFDAALILNHGTEGIPGVTKLSPGRATYFPSPDLDTLIGYFDVRIGKVALDREKYEGPLDSEANSGLLCFGSAEMTFLV